VVIAWEEQGSGPPVVFVHGLTEDRHGWDPTIARLQSIRRCVRLDLRGHGQSSDAVDYSALAMASDVAELVHEAQIAQPPLVVGHSLGAVVATAYATSAPVQGVVNIDQSLRLGDFAAALQPFEALLRGPEFHETLLAIFEGLGIPEKLDPRYRAYLDTLHADARSAVVLGVWDLVFSSSPDELTAIAESLLGSITVPYLSIHGSDPGPGYVEWLTALVPTATVEIWDGDGHYPHLADPERLAARLRELSEPSGPA
jgi:pimeloyl-ACP methyl ester carboxylesterase